MQKIFNLTAELMNTLGFAADPFGIHYTDNLPEKAIGPKKGQEISVELEKANKIDWKILRKDFACFLRSIRIARKKNRAAYMSKENYGCVGGMFFTGFLKPGLAWQSYFVSTGIPGSGLPCERYMPSPESSDVFMKKINPATPPAKYLVAKPLDQFTKEEKPEFIILYARPEIMTGIFTLLTFTSGEVDCVRIPFGSGCCHILAWPRYYRDKGKEVGVLGTFDPSARPYMGMDELSMTVSLELYEKMLNCMHESFFITDTWQSIKAMGERSARAWGEIE